MSKLNKIIKSTVLYYNRTDSFCKKFLTVYKLLTGDRAIDKNDTFYAHAIYQPTLVRKKILLR